jgi:hypothetical protein
MEKSHTKINNFKFKLIVKFFFLLLLINNSLKQHDFFDTCY